MEEKVLLITKEAGSNVALAGRNVEKLFHNTADAIKVFDVLKADRIVVEAGALEHIQAKFGGAQQ
jgi:ribosomal protein L4